MFTFSCLVWGFCQPGLTKVRTDAVTATVGSLGSHGDTTSRSQSGGGGAGSGGHSSVKSPACRAVVLSLENVEQVDALVETVKRQDFDDEYDHELCATSDKSLSEARRHCPGGFGRGRSTRSTRGTCGQWSEYQSQGDCTEVGGEREMGGNEEERGGTGKMSET